jgi:hypothetical protein
LRSLLAPLGPARKLLSFIVLSQRPPSGSRFRMGWIVHPVKESV